MRRPLLILTILALVAMPLSADLKGVVISTDGKPIADAKVAAYALETSEQRIARHRSAQPERVPVAITSTNAQGSFSLQLKEPVVDLGVTASGFAPEGLRLRNDEEIGTIALREAAMVKGTITSGGKPVAGATVIYRAGAEVVAKTDERGTYSVPDPAKWAARAWVFHPDFAPLTITVGRTVMRLSASHSLTPGTRVRGRVTGLDGNPAAKALVSIDGLPSGETDAEGTFDLTHVPADWRELTVRRERQAASIPRGPSNELNVRLGKGATISGDVRDAKTQKALAGAEVALVSTIGMASRTEVGSVLADAKGSYSFSGIVPGDYEILVRHPGYRGPELSLAVSGDVAKTILATQLATITGSVVDENRKAVAGALVATEQQEEGNPMRGAPRMRFMEPERRYSGPDGRFVLRNVSPDEKLAINAVRKGFPAATDGPHQLASGETKRNVVLTIPTGIALTGKVVDADGNPLSGVAVSATQADSSGGPRRMVVRMVIGREEADDSIRSASDGTFTMRVRKGTHDVSFRREGFAPKSVRGVKVDDAGAEPLEVKLEPGVEISGRVVRGGVGVEGVNVMAVSPDRPTSPPRAVTGPDGSFTLSDLEPGSVMLVVNKMEDFIQERRSVKAPARDLVVELPAGQTISGRVVDKATKKPIVDFQAGVSNSRSGGGMMMVAPPSLRRFHDEEGKFVLENVPAGPVQIVANAPGYAQGKLSGYTIQEGKNLGDLELALEPGATLTGKVTGPDGAPVAGASVQLESDSDITPIGRMSEVSTRTDAAGAYRLEGLEAGERTIIVEKDGFIPERKTITLAAREQDLNVRLSRGAPVSGVVVADHGGPVADAMVTADSAVADAGFNRTRTDANGRFRFEGLLPGRYNFSASKAGFMNGRASDIDVTSGPEVRITLKKGATIYGRVTGLPASDLSKVTVSADAAGNSSSAPVDSSGNYRIEGAPIGTVRVIARSGSFGEMRSSDAKVVEVAGGAEVQTDLAFRSDVVISGRISRDGKPYTDANVSFSPADPKVTSFAATTTDGAGNYEVTGLEPGEYRVRVMDMRRLSPYSTTYRVSGSDTFDIDIRGGSLTGRVVDGETGQGISEARVSIQKTGDRNEGFFGGTTVLTDPSGNFTIESVDIGALKVRAEKGGYGQQVADVTTREGSTETVDLKLFKNDGAVLKIIDARDGRALESFLRVVDGSGNTAFEGPAKIRSDGTVRLALSPGSYRATISAFGYATRMTTISSPVAGLTIGMTPGGTIVVESKSSERRLAKLLAGAEEYPLGFGRRNIVIPPGTTTLSNVAPGTYSLAIVDDSGQTKDSVTVTVVEGQTRNVAI